MKKKIVNIVLFLLMLALSGGISWFIAAKAQDLSDVFTSTVSTPSSALWLYVLIGAMLTLWLIVFIVFVKLNVNIKLFGIERTDRLTGLGSKKAVRLNYETLLKKNNQINCLCYLAFDVQRIVDRYGASWSENMQKGAADILSSTCKDNDHVARLGEGIFLLSVTDKDGMAVHQKIQLIVDKLNKYQYQILLEAVAPFHAGMYIVGMEKTPYDVALANAKLGYDYACNNNTDTYLCTKELLLKEASRKRLREKLNRAIDNEQFDPYLQFVYSVKYKKFTAAEVLSRWNDPEEGLLMPGYYINDMRETGVIEKFDIYMFERVCALLASWKDTDMKHLALACDITRITISSVDFMTKVREILQKYDFDHSLLIIEITEDALINNHTVAYNNIMEFKKEGFCIAIDDFGAGNTSLNDLSDFPIDHIKIDRSLITRISTKRGESLLQGIIKFAHSMELRVVCEGVETEEQRDIVIGDESDYIQGYLYSYVFPIEEAKEYYHKFKAKAKA